MKKEEVTDIPLETILGLNDKAKPEWKRVEARLAPVITQKVFLDKGGIYPDIFRTRVEVPDSSSYILFVGKRTSPAGSGGGTNTVYSIGIWSGRSELLGCYHDNPGIRDLFESICGREREKERAYFKVELDALDAYLEGKD